MNPIHDVGVQNKRTSINELLNPVGATAPAQYPQQPPSQMNNGAQYSLRAASWEAQKEELGSRRSEPENGSCRYPPSSSAPPPPMYADHYPRPVRPGDEAPPHYSMGTAQSWSSSHEPPNASYGAQLMSPVYADERVAASGEGGPRSHPPPPPTPSHPPYQQDVGGHPHPPHAQYAQYFQYAPYPHPPRKFLIYCAIPRPTPRGAPAQPMSLPPPRAGGPVPPPGYYTGPPMGYLVQAPPMVQQKRVSEQVEEEQGAPKAKKARATKAKTADSSGPSRRGQNQKKRDTAQSGNQNGVCKDKASGAGASMAAMPFIVPSEDSNNPDGNSLQPELQFARCMSNRYRSEEFPRCVSCTRRWAGDTCRFQGIRFFLKNQNRDIVGISFVDGQKPDAPTMNFPNKWNISLELEHLQRVKRTVADALLPVLKQEMQHLNLPEIIRRPRESEVRATCDTCMTSIFSSSWMCRLCGREACAECFEQVKELTTDRVGAPEAEIAALQARREKHAHINPFFLSCTRRNEHQAKDFSPMSRFCKAELTQALEEMETLLRQPISDASRNKVDSPRIKSSPKPPRDLWGSTSPGSSSTSGSEVIKSAGIPPDPSSFASASASSAPTSAGAQIPSHETVLFPDAELTDEKFRRVWEKGVPLVVSGLSSKFHLQWTPEYFSSKYGTQSCLILECQNEQNKRVTVAEFFALFGKYEGRRDCWKLKDWPPSTDFKTAFPELFDDFSRVTPVPNYVRRDGVLNIASHFPSNAIAPDLGPKMYNAMASFESQGSKGSTRLHMDMADAVNIMTYASPTPDGRAGCAAWDIFRAEDTPKLRKFLRKKFKGQYQQDPIHSQQFYLDSTLRQELYKDHGVMSHRIYQKPGEAVFIPAGCAHQVCNLADCIKVACDFVSPENIERCENLTSEFREQNQSMAWKEDVLQLRTMMWFAWLSCVRQEKEILDG
ncbi:hypothetical protein C8Q80DRAFT_1309487 [Daedaleopsis nitida]|nr:hypothetical protein C8Q80DRAFT_1309487 [Daedaleopsis nitida]